MKPIFQVSIEANQETEPAIEEFLHKFSPLCISVESGPEFTHCIKCFFEIIPVNFYTDLQQFLESLPSFGLDPGETNVEIIKLQQTDWEEAWKEFYQPLAIGKHILILPEWLDAPPDNQRQILRLNPGMAFGTGQHSSTRLCLELAENVLKPDMSVLDVGCGSGILAIYAAKSGCNNVIGFDIDPAVLNIARYNASINSLISSPLWFAGEVNALNKDDFEIIFMNLTSEIIQKVANNTIKLLKNRGICLFSGIIVDDKTKIIDFLTEIGFDILEIRELSGWIGIMGQKNAALFS